MSGNTFKLTKTHILVNLPLYLYAIRIKGLGSYEVGTSLFNLILPIIIFFYIKKYNVKFLILLFFYCLYVLLISATSGASLKIANFIFSSCFLFFYLNYCFVYFNSKIILSHFRDGMIFYLGTSLVLYIFQFSTNIDIGALFFDSYLVLPRISGAFMEPSHLGITVAILFFSHNHKYLLKTKFLTKTYLLTLLVLAQSSFGFFIYFLLKLNRWILAILISILFVYLYYNFSVGFFFSNSGLVRLYGLFYLVNNLDILTIFGSGVGYGSNLFQLMLKDQLNIPEFSGFLADFFIDLGILGSSFFLFLLSYQKPHKLTIYILFFLLYLQFGFSVSLFPYLLTFTYLILSNGYKDSRKIN
jgi:hypothetical protein